LLSAVGVQDTLAYIISVCRTHSLTGNAMLLDPSRVFEPTVLEGFIRCTQEEQPDVIISVSLGKQPRVG